MKQSKKKGKFVAVRCTISLVFTKLCTDVKVQQLARAYMNRQQQYSMRRGSRDKGSLTAGIARAEKFPCPVPHLWEKFVGGCPM